MKLKEGETIEDAIRRIPLGRLMRIRIAPLLPTAATGATPLLDLVVKHVEKALIEAGLEHCDGKLGKTASILGIHRNTLRTKMQDYGFAVGTRRRFSKRNWRPKKPD